MATKVIKPVNPVAAKYQLVFNFSLRSKYIFLGIVAFTFYANSLFNTYAFDDRGIILENTYVQMGLSGIPKILTTDSWASYYSEMGSDPSSKQLTGGRYRPFSELIFAIEQQLFNGAAIQPHFCHLINVLAYITCILSLFYFLEKILLKKIPGGSDISFLAAFLFTIHPLHTEVVANIKSLDEILSLLFIMLTFIYSFKYQVGKRILHLIIAGVSFLIALLSKEYAVTLIFFIPFLFYLLLNKSPVAAIKATIPYYIVFVIYLLLRYNAIGFYHSNIQVTSPSSNPYYYATAAQKIATEWFVLGKYLQLLIFPYPLSYDYSYHQIPFHSFSDISVLFTLLFYMVILVFGIQLARRKNELSFAVFFFLINIFMVSNFVLDIGATMGERLVFHSSLGFVILLSALLVKIISGDFLGAKLTLQRKKIVALGFILIIGLLCFSETIKRNTQWKNDDTLFIHDVKVVPNSFFANNNAGYSYLGYSEKTGNTPIMRKEYLDSAHNYLLRALQINSAFFIAYSNLGDVFLKQGLVDSAKYCYDMVEKLNPLFPLLKSNYAQLYFIEGLHLAMRNRAPREGITYMKKAVSLDSADADIWYNMAIAYYQLHLYDSARYAFMKTLLNKPDSMDEINAKKDLQDLAQKKD